MAERAEERVAAEKGEVATAVVKAAETSTATVCGLPSRSLWDSALGTERTGGPCGAVFLG